MKKQGTVGKAQPKQAASKLLINRASARTNVTSGAIPRSRAAVGKPRNLSLAQLRAEKDPKTMSGSDSLKKKVRQPSGSGLSRCAENYAKALVNPWGQFDDLPCVPCTPADLTFRYRTITRGVFSSGTQGVGFLEWAPLNPTSDQNSIRYSTSAFDGVTQFGAEQGVTPGTFVQPRSSTLPANLFLELPSPEDPQDYLSARLVASGMRFRNVTPELYRGGTVIACRSDTGIDMKDVELSSFLNSLESVRQSAAVDDWMCWNWIPQDASDYDFPDSSVNYSYDSGSTYTKMNFGVVITNCPTAGGQSNSFEYEIVDFWEITGTHSGFAVPSLTRSHADPVGFSRVLEGVAIPPQSLLLRDLAKGAATQIIEEMAHSDSAAKTVEDLLGLAGMAIPVVGTLVKSLSSFLVL